ncbi:SapC family protein [Novispirillum itersonii]|uniref:SapC protein n=1 Tax=Novispirillum itersonii TaxID=189 RepID=A0A7X0DMP2_NOVIT|nr:SapC family protein [Novispirillum itersonii]MBB6211261.1 hypothetical protein [Novispirillum itersonii]
MFQSLIALDATLHRSLGLLPGAGFSFAKNSTTAPIAFSEMVNAARIYPIVFPLASYAPQVLLSLDHGTNLFVAEDGKWLADYIPAHFRRWPFMLQGRNENGEASVLFEVSAPTLKEGEGTPLFEPDGEPSAALKTIIEFLAHLDGAAVYTESLLSALEPVLVEQEITVQENGQPISSLQGFRVVDVEKFSALPQETFMEWRANGLLPLVYAQILSMGNVNRLATLQSERNKR